MSKLVWFLDNILPNLFILSVIIVLLVDREKALNLNTTLLGAIGLFSLSLLVIWASTHKRKPKAKGH